MEEKEYLARIAESLCIARLGNYCDQCGYELDENYRCEECNERTKPER